MHNNIHIYLLIYTTFAMLHLLHYICMLHLPYYIYNIRIII